MDKAAEILQPYNIVPQAIVPITDRVQQIKASGNEYALKRSRLKEDSIEKWIDLYKMAHEQRFLNVLPIYLTHNEKLYVKNEQAFYYLSPWIQSRIKEFSKSELELFFQRIGKIHLQTKKHHTIKKDKLEATFYSYKDICQNAQKSLLSAVEQCERTHFPSPLQLQILTHYREVSFAFHLSQQLVDRFLSSIESESMWSSSLTHGNLRKSHIFQDYLINWESVRFQHASLDLIDFFSNLSESYGSAASLIESFPAYLAENPLENQELVYLTLYLLNVNDYLNHIKNLQENPEKESQSVAARTVELEKIHRRLVFGIQFHENLASFEKPIPENTD